MFYGSVVHHRTNCMVCTTIHEAMNANELQGKLPQKLGMSNLRKVHVSTEKTLQKLCFPNYLTLQICIILIGRTQRHAASDFSSGSSKLNTPYSRKLSIIYHAAFVIIAHVCVKPNSTQTQIKCRTYLS